MHRFQMKLMSSMKGISLCLIQLVDDDNALFPILFCNQMVVIFSATCIPTVLNFLYVAEVKYIRKLDFNYGLSDIKIC